MEVVHLLDAHAINDASAGKARGEGDIKGAAFDGDTIFGGIEDGVFFGMDG